MVVVSSIYRTTHTEMVRMIRRIGNWITDKVWWNWRTRRLLNSLYDTIGEGDREMGEEIFKQVMSEWGKRE